MSQIDDNSIDLVVTSPPYPMVEMWDEILTKQNSSIGIALQNNDSKNAFELMHQELDKVWDEVDRVTKNNAFVCINIGDATRTINGEFQLFSNHSKIIQYFLNKGFVCLPAIIWRKPTNSPNKFMGSGMLPAGAYITLEHEYILVFRKGGKRIFKTDSDKKLRQQSSFFWEERNQWFSDLWEIRGTQQKLKTNLSRERSGAYPFEIPYRLINMYSVKGDTILDPFLGTGTTSLAALTSERNSIGFEVDESLKEEILENISENNINNLNQIIKERLQTHIDFIQKKSKENTDFKHFNHNYQFPVITSQETDLAINFIKDIKQKSESIYAAYSENFSLTFNFTPPQPKIGQQSILF